MKRLVAIFAAGALVLAVAPTVFAANACTGNWATDRDGNVPPCDTSVQFHVNAGTMIWAPASIDLGSGIPGQIVTIADPVAVQYVTNESDKTLYVESTDLTWNDGSTTWTIPHTSLYLGSAVAANKTLDTTRAVGALSASTGNVYDTISNIYFTTQVPSVKANNDGPPTTDYYTGTFTWGIVAD